MEVRRRKVAGGAPSRDASSSSSASSTSASSRRRAEDEGAEIVRVRPEDARSQWTITRAEDGGAMALVSTALTSLGESPLVTFIIDLVKQAFNLLWSAPSATGAAAIDPRTKQLLDEFRSMTTVSYDPKNSEHEDQLLHLWACSFPQESLDDRVSDQWKRLGFQGRDPATDFRGCGVFGLQQLISYARKYPEAFQFHLAGTHHEEAYPFAITAINLVNLIFQLLGWGMRPSNSPAKMILINMLFANAEGERSFVERQAWRDATNDSEDTSEAEEESSSDDQGRRRTLQVFSEVFVATFHLFDKEWKSFNAHYMDFPKVIASTQAKLETFLQRNTTVDDITHFNYTNNMSIRQ